VRVLKTVGAMTAWATRECRDRVLGDVTFSSRKRERKGLGVDRFVDRVAG
jgi:hypothetical protein